MFSLYADRNLKPRSHYLDSLREAEQRGEIHLDRYDLDSMADAQIRDLCIDLQNYSSDARTHDY